jgi:hypothetical protein
MPKFNVRDTRAAAATGPIATTPDAALVVNHEGAIGYGRDAKSDLFLLATTTVDLTAETFYEGGDARVRRFRDLISRVAPIDPDWTYRFLTWLRTKGNIRTAAVVGGVEACRALAASGIPGGRHMISTVLRRADEPGEAIAYHHQVHGRALPMPFKRGVADAAARLYTEYALLKYDTPSHGLRFADVLALTHARPDPGKPWQGELFAYAVDRRYGRPYGGVDAELPPLPAVELNARLRADWAAGRYALDSADLSSTFADAGMTWEDVLPALGGKVDKAALWRALIPSMGFMARLRNLRNFDQAGLTDADVADVIAMLGDPEQVRASKQLPLRFLSAYRAAPSLRWSYPLERALDVSVENMPELPGRTLILVDVSTSMNNRLSDRTDLLRWDAAASFGLALARRCADADVVAYSGPTYWGEPPRAVTMVFPPVVGESLLTSIARWQRDGYFMGGGTETAEALRRHYAGHDRAVILTDEQNQSMGQTFEGIMAEVGRAMPADRPLTTFNLAGYATSHAATNRNRLILGGLTDAMFPLIAQVERGYPGGWPWVGDPDITGLPSYDRPSAATTPVTGAPRSTVPEGSQGGRWHVSDGGWTGTTTGRD